MANPLIANFLGSANAAPPALGTSIAMPGSAPSMGAPVLPSVSLAPPPPPTQLQIDQKRRTDLINEGSGVDQIQNPLLRGIARAGDIAASVFTPRLAQFIPGTTLHHQLLVGQATQNAAADQAEEAGAAKTQQEQALAQQETAKAAALADPHKAVDPSKTVQTDDGVFQLNPETGKYDVRVGDRVDKPKFSVHDTAAGPLFVNEATGAAQHLTVDGVPVGPQMKLSQSQPIMGDDGKPHTYMLNDKGEKVVDLGVHYERPQVTNVNAGLGALDRETKQFGASHQKAVDSANSQLEKIADARAMINGNAEAQGLGIPKVLTALVGGQGTGVRITQAELESIAHARGITGDVEGTLNKWSGKGALSREQQIQLTQIMDDVKQRIIEKQAIASRALDSINGASSRDQIIQADKEARKNLSDFENYGHYVGQTVKLKNGQSITIQHVHPDGSFD